VVAEPFKRTRVWGISGEVRGSESCICHHTDHSACVVHCGIGLTRVGQSIDGGELNTQGWVLQAIGEEARAGGGGGEK
jgi:hypothetical protein